MLKMTGLAIALAMMASASVQAADVEWNGLEAQATALPDGGFVLATPQGERRIAAQPMRSETGSAMFDALFALAQQELEADRVDAIRDPAFDEGKPVACRCFETGERWPYVWTRDVSYATDLALARLDPERARASLRFKLSRARGEHAPAGLFVAQDTGSGGSWPVSTDRVVWFLAVEDLLDDPAFAGEVWQALQGTLAQDREYAFDQRIGLYRGETSFLDWREQTYPGWTASDVRFIGESFALSTNVLHYRALRLGERLAKAHGDAAAAGRYGQWAGALRRAIDVRFWREERGQYMSYIGTAAHPVPFEKYDLLGLSLGIVSDVLPRERAAAALARYPATAAGSPVVWPQEREQPIYHNRALWPFVSAYSLRAARRLDDAPRIAMEIESLLRGTALASSNMENYEMLSQAVHVDEGRLSGPVVNSPRQLWSVAGYLSMVIEGVFGVEADGSVAPKLPARLVPLLFGERDRIVLRMDGRRWTLLRPARDAGDLLVAGRLDRRGDETIVHLVGARSRNAAPPPLAEAHFAPETPAEPRLQADGADWRVQVPADATLYLDGRPYRGDAAALRLPREGIAHCLSLTRRDAHWESLHGPTVCTGAQATLAGDRAWTWLAPAAGRYRASLRYRNGNGPINTGVTAAVKRLVLRCEGQPPQRHAVVMPHSVGEQDSIHAVFDVPTAGRCGFALEEGFNMSGLEHFAHYTGGAGGRSGVLNAADVVALQLVRVGADGAADQ